MTQGFGSVFRRDAVVGGLRQGDGCYVRESVPGEAGNPGRVVGPAAAGDDDQDRSVQVGELAAVWAPGHDDLGTAEVLPGCGDGDPGWVQRPSPGFPGEKSAHSLRAGLG